MEFSGTPYALCKALGEAADLPFELTQANLETPRKFRVGQLFYAAKQAQWDAKNGFGLSSEYMSAAWTRSGVTLRQGDIVIVCHPISPRQVVAACRRGTVKAVNYVDMPLNSYFENYDLSGRIPTGTRRRLVHEEADSLSASARILALDEEGAREIRNGIAGIEPSKVTSIGRGANIETDQLETIRHKRVARGKNERLELLFIGKDAARKGLYEAIEGIEQLPQTVKDRVKLHVVGPDKADVPNHSYIEKYGLLDRDKSPDLFAALLARADLGLLLSKAEGNPGSIAEFLSCGVPAIASGLPRLTEIFNGAAVEFVTMSDMAAHFSDLVAAIVEQPPLLARLTEHAERERDRFTWRPVVERMLHCLQGFEPSSESTRSGRGCSTREPVNTY